MVLQCKNQKSSKKKLKTNIETTDSECMISDSYDSFDEINLSMKSLVSDSTDVETEPMMKNKNSINQLTEKKKSQTFPDSFSQNIPKWGGLLVDKNNNSLRY